MSDNILAHKIKLYPTDEQRVWFEKTAGYCRFTYNWGLAEWNRLYELGEKTSAFELKKKFNAIKGEQFPWIKEVDSSAIAQEFTFLGGAWSKFFKALKKKSGSRVGVPKFKKKSGKARFYASNGWLKTVEIEGKRYVKMPKSIGLVRILEPLRFEGKIMAGNISKQANDWFISIQVDVGEGYSRERKGDGIVGLDLGVKSMIVTSDGEVFENPKALGKKLKKLRREQRRLSRKQKGSNNRKKQRMIVAKVYQDVSNVRANAIHQATAKICKNNKVVCIEDLNVAGMVKNHKLARAISDVSFGEIRRQIEYKTTLHNGTCLKVDRFFPSSKTCSNCGTIKEDLKLSDRTFVCKNCSIVLDRDVNAAINIRNTAGHAGINACGDNSADFNAKVVE